MTYCIPELVVVKYILIYNNYIKYYKYIDIDKELKYIYILYKTLCLIHTAIPETDKSIDELESSVYSGYPNMSQSDKQGVHALCQQLRSLEVSDGIASDIVYQVAQRNASRQLAIKALDFSEGRVSSEELAEAYRGVNASESSSHALLSSRNFVTDDLDLIETTTIGEGGLYWPLRALNSSLGPIRKGDCGLVFARPETGKTTFLAHVATHMAAQLSDDFKCVWFNNEEVGEKVRLRTFQAALGLSTSEVFSNKAKTMSRYKELLKGRLMIWDDASIQKREVEAICRDVNPGLIIFDQIDKIHGFNADRPDLVFGKIYQWERELAKQYCPIIGTCQADGTAEGVKWLTMHHVAEAKTSKQAEMDWILGIGKSHEGGTEDVRFFSISKNKLIGDKDTDPELRHGRFDVWIRPTIAQYEDIE